MLALTLSMGARGPASAPFSLWGNTMLAGFLATGLRFQVTRLPSVELHTNCLPS